MKPCKKSELDPQAVIDSEQLTTFLDCQSQFMIKGVAEDFTRYWTVMRDIILEKDFFIPAEYVWYCFDERHQKDGHFMFNASTNGVAAHFSFENAASSAICEVIERDAIMIWWLNRLKPPCICCELLSEDLISSITEIEKSGYGVSLLNLTLDSFPVILAVARNKAKR